MLQCLVREIVRVCNWPLVCLSYLLMAGGFHLDVCGGEFTDSEIIVMLGENGEPTGPYMESLLML